MPIALLRWPEARSEHQYPDVFQAFLECGGLGNVWRRRKVVNFRIPHIVLEKCADAIDKRRPIYAVRPVRQDGEIQQFPQHLVVFWIWLGVMDHMKMPVRVLRN